MAEETKVAGITTTGSLAEALRASDQRQINQQVGLNAPISLNAQTMVSPAPNRPLQEGLDVYGLPGGTFTGPNFDLKSAVFTPLNPKPFRQDNLTLNPKIVEQTPGLLSQPESTAEVGSGVKTSSATDTTQTTGEQRSISCPNCQGGDFLTKIAGRVFSSICGFLQKTFHIKVEIIETITDYVRERIPTSKLAAFDGNCPRCGGSGKITDPSDDRAKYAQAGQIAQRLAPQIEKEEAKLGNGGNRVVLVQNNEYKKVGLVMNNAPSYRVEYDAGYRNKGIGGPDTINPKYGLMLSEGGTANHVQGLNPIAPPGGSFILECTNRFSVVTGALGVDITTNGPVTIKGGITQIVGPEVSIGSKTGKLALEGDVVNIVGRSIEMAPTDGHSYVRGTFSCSGNAICGGHGHFESASVVKLETVGKNETSKASAPSNLFGGPAYWGGESLEAVEAALQELKGYVLANTSEPSIATLITSPRFLKGLNDCAKNLLYVQKPQELVQTGYALYLGLKLPVYNYPHIHALPDQLHVHDTRVPDIDCTADTAKELRTRQAGINGPAPLHKRSTSIVDVAVSALKAIGLVHVAEWLQLEDNYKA